MRIAAVLLAVLMASCTPSLHSLATDQDRNFEPALLGSWRSADDRSKDRFDVLRGKNGAYRVVLYEGDRGSGIFTARLVQLGTHRFIDLHPEASLGDGFFKGHFVRTHTFGRISLNGDQLRIGMMDPDWLKTAEGRKAGLPSVILDGDAVLTASTAQLREFAARFADSKAFGDSREWGAWVREK